MIAASATDPLVTCIMPTADRRPFVAQAIDQFMRQDYGTRELIVVDDGADRVADLMPRDSRIRYVPLKGRVTIGAKRNLACSLARGELVVHWDDDDWMDDSRIRRQAHALLERGADACGTSRFLLVDPSARLAWQYVHPIGMRPWLAGFSLCYRASLWRHNRFPHVVAGEDALFLWSDESKILHDMNDSTLCIATVHAGNTSLRPGDGPPYHPVPFEEALRVMGIAALTPPQ